jgi:hypothetical protein
MKLPIAICLLILPYLGLAAPISEESNLSKRGWVPASIKGSWANTKTAMKNPKVFKAFRDLQSIDSAWVRGVAETQRHSIETLDATAKELADKVKTSISKVPSGGTNSDEFVKAKDAYAQFLEIRRKAQLMDQSVQSKIDDRHASLAKSRMSDSDVEDLDYHSLDSKFADKLRVKNAAIDKEKAVLEAQQSAMQSERAAFLARMQQIDEDLIKSASDAKLTFEHSRQIRKAKASF